MWIHRQITKWIVVISLIRCRWKRVIRSADESDVDSCCWSLLMPHFLVKNFSVRLSTLLQIDQDIKHKVLGSTNYLVLMTFHPEKIWSYWHNNIDPINLRFERRDQVSVFVLCNSTQLNPIQLNPTQSIQSNSTQLNQSYPTQPNSILSMPWNTLNLAARH